MTALHTDPSSLARSALGPRLASAIEAVRAAQASGEVARWEGIGRRRLLRLADGTLFVPDQQDAKVGRAGMIIGGIVFTFGALLGAIVLDGDQAEPWMRWVAPLLLAVGGYAASTGRRDNRRAQAAPRLTGAYLFADALLHVGPMGCRTFPRACIQGFSYRQRSGSNGFSLFIRFVDEAGEAREVVLFSEEDVTETLEAWLAG